MYRVSCGVRSTRNEDGGIVLDIDQGQMFRLNPTGALILELLTKGQDERSIASQLVQQFQIPEETAIADIRGFLSTLETHQLVTNGKNGKRS